MSSRSTVTFGSFHNTIGGKPRGSNKVDNAIDPSNKTALWDVPVANSNDLDDAVSAAESAFTEWSRSLWASRQDSLRQMHNILEGRKDEMAALLTREGGKPIQFGALEVQHALGFLDFHSKQEPIEESVIQDDETLQLRLRYGPIGVVAAICPWNYPLVLAIAKIGAALITGNCVIVKPSPFTPYSILKFAGLVQEVLPPGVLQALHGDSSLGPKLCSHPGIHKISFTGSTATGKKIMAACAPTLKRLTLELGGNNASIVCSDVDPKIVAPQVALGSFFNSGQLCVASKRIYVHRDIYNEFLESFVQTVKSWTVGPTSEMQSGVTLGPVQNAMQYNIVKEIFNDTATAGYKFALGREQNWDSSSYVIRPAIIDRPPDNSRIVTEEPFGPIVPVLSWKDEEEVLARVNADKTGLGAAVWSSDVDRANRLAQRIDAGNIWINSFEKPLPQGYFSGHKESGLGGEWGQHGLLAYCQAQTVHQYKSVVRSEGRLHNLDYHDKLCEK